MQVKSIINLTFNIMPNQKNLIDSLEKLKKEIKKIETELENSSKKHYVPGDVFEHESVEIIVQPMDDTANRWFKLLKNDKIVAPLVEAVLKKENDKGYIDTGLVLFVDSALGLEKENFKINCQVSLNLQGFYDLSVYVYYHKEVQNLGGYNEGLDNVYIKIPFFKEKIFPSDCKQNLKNINTIEVFVINTDPETSRGTETTVESGDD